MKGVGRETINDAPILHQRSKHDLSEQIAVLNSVSIISFPWMTPGGQRHKGMVGYESTKETLAVPCSED